MFRPSKIPSLEANLFGLLFRGRDSRRSGNEGGEIIGIVGAEQCVICDKSLSYQDGTTTSTTITSAIPGKGVFCYVEIYQNSLKLTDWSEVVKTLKRLVGEATEKKQGQSP